MLSDKSSCVVTYITLTRCYNLNFITGSGPVRALHYSGPIGCVLMYKRLITTSLHGATY